MVAQILSLAIPKINQIVTVQGHNLLTKTSNYNEVKYDYM